MPKIKPKAVAPKQEPVVEAVMSIDQWNEALERVANAEDMEDSQKIDELHVLRSMLEGALEFFEDLDIIPEVQERRSLLKDVTMNLDDALDQLGDDVTADKPKPKWRAEDVVATPAAPGTLERVRAEREAEG